MTDNDHYYRRRIEEELAAVEAASNSAISQIHLEMAKHYLEVLETDPDRSTGQFGELG